MNQVTELVLQDPIGKKERRKPKKKRFMLHEINATNDIKYRGPLSYRHLRIIGWLSFALTQAGILMAYGSSLDKSIAKLLGDIPSFLQGFSGFMMPLFLLATFSTILMAKNGYKRLILQYTGAIIGIYALFAFVYEHYLVGLTNSLFTQGNIQEARETVELIFLLANQGNLAGFNIFVDLLLCTLFTFFVNYQPKKAFKGKWVYLFRSFAILPVAYELACIVLKIRSSFGDISITSWIFPLITTKPPMLFVAFIILALFVKIRERIFTSRGYTHEEYQDFLKTNVNSLHFSLFTSILLIVITIVDFLLFLTLSGFVLTKIGIAGDAASLVKNWGFGVCGGVAGVIPIVLLFSYTRTYKDNSLDIIIPIAGVGLLALVYIEGLYWFLKYLPDLIKDWTGKLFK